jgi:hypothetical protein
MLKNQSNVAGNFEISGSRNAVRQIKNDTAKVTTLLRFQQQTTSGLALRFGVDAHPPEIRKSRQ